MKSMLKSLGGAAVGKISTDTTKTMMFIVMIIHIGVNIGNFAAVNNDENDEKAKKETFQAHAIISSVVFGLLMIIKLIGLVPFIGPLLTQDIFQGGYSYIGVPFFIHLIVSIVTAVLSFVIPDYDPQLLSNIFNGISTLVCGGIIILSRIPTDELNKWAEDATKAPAAPEDKKTGETTTNTAAPENVKVEVKDKEFGKRQRRRNPRRKRY